MKKPKIRIYFSRVRGIKFNWKPYIWPKTWYMFINNNVLWKEKGLTPRVEIIPSWEFWWGWWRLYVSRGNEEEWEWYLWVTKYCNEDINKAKSEWPWFDGITGEQSKPWLKYNN
jgi:hypothetical protein